MSQLSGLEQAVIELQLDGDNSVLAGLRRQLAGLTVRNREQTGVGFFTYLDTDPSVERVVMPAHSSPLRGVRADVEGFPNGVGFLLFVEEGRLSMLEGFSYEEAWPDVNGVFTLKYSEADRKATMSRLTL